MAMVLAKLATLQAPNVFQEYWLADSATWSKDPGT